ncbi:MAG: DUF1295 domain-containing protein, partial [Coriobacteriia bacterium]|nr:DUF1295 domain-containing protein [Coriobacteriia bacterium]
MAERASRTTAAAPLVATLIGAGMAWAGSQGGMSVGGVPVFTLAIALAFLVQWVVFVPSYLAQTERYFDLTGSLTYISVTVLAVALSGPASARSWLLLALVLVWAGRLGAFLFRRVRRAGKDDRFDTIKQSLVRFLTTWTLQGLWVSLTLAAALAAITAGGDTSGVDAFAVV